MTRLTVPRPGPALALGLALALAGLAGCQGQSGDPMTIAPVPPQGHVQGAVLPARAGGYSALGQAPVADQLSATYVLDTDAAILAQVALDPTFDYAVTPLGQDQWFGQSRCGVLDRNQDDLQMACITPLVDGVLTVVGVTAQTAEELSQLANAVVSTLP
ncbi:MAG: hypothetical protein LBK42_08690 [Propionibacteriaceae bacterium]|nr:hypothetical protein [Propionibacteriaceae bacterium]